MNGFIDRRMVVMTTPQVNLTEDTVLYHWSIERYNDDEWHVESSGSSESRTGAISDAISMLDSLER